jgi:hypothetical protein
MVVPIVAGAVSPNEKRSSIFIGNFVSDYGVASDGRILSSAGHPMRH